MPRLIPKSFSSGLFPLLGLLTLLLWGQCGLFQQRQSRQLFEITVIRPDTLVSSDQPGTKMLYLTLQVTNPTRRPLLVHSVAGSLLLKGEKWGQFEVGNSTQTSLRVPAGQRRNLRLPVRLLPSPDFPADSGAKLLRVLRDGPERPVLFFSFGFSLESGPLRTEPCYYQVP